MRIVGRAFATVAATAALSACSLPYYWQAVGGHMDLLKSRTPIERALDDGSLDLAKRRVLSQVPAILELASGRLGLDNDGSYSSYVELDRPYVVWNVVAAREFSTDPVRWCFLFAGCVAYRGYFDRSDAVEFRDRLAADGLDTYLGGATAYSTLGHFEDPVLSTMLGAGADALAGLLFHELAHQKVYVKGDSEFNEAYATVIEEHGRMLWLTQNADSDALAAYGEARARRDRIAALVLRQQRRLERIYASAADAETKRHRKREAFGRMREEFAALERGFGGAGEYSAWMEAELNNASLAAVATYRRWLPALRTRIAEVGLDAFQGDIERAAELGAEERRALLESWERGSTSAAVATRR